MFRRIDRYLFRELIPPFLLGLAVYTFVLFMNHLFVIAEKALSKNLGWDLTARLFLAGIPEILVLSIPMAVLLGVMIAVGRLSSDHEWIALQATGQGPRRLVVPVLIFGILASLASFFVQNELFPRASFWQRSLRGQLLFASNLASDLRPRGFYTAIPDVVFFVDEIRKSEEKRLVNVVLHKRDRQTGESDLFVARYGDLYPDAARPGYLLIDLYDAVQHHYDTVEGTDYLSLRWDQFRDEIDTGSFLKDILTPTSKGVQDSHLDELLDEFAEARSERAEIEALLAGGQPDTANRRLVSDVRLRAVTNELHTRFALPLACVLFALLAVPLGVTRVRSGKGAGFAVSLGVILFYYVTFTIARNQGYTGRIPVWLGVWLANMLVLPWALWGLWQLHRAESDRSGPIGRAYFATVRALRDLRLRSSGTDPETRRKIEQQSVDEDPLESISGTSNRFIGRFDGYVLRTYFKLLGYSLASVYLVSYLVEFKQLLDDGLFKHGRSIFEVLDFFRLLAPGNLLLLLPISCLVAAVITFTLLTRSGELTALKAAGVSMHRAALPVILSTTLLSIGLWTIDDRIAPAATRDAQAAEDHLLNKRPRSYGSPVNGTWGFGPEGKRLYHYDRHDPVADVYFGFSALTLDRDAPRILDHRYSPIARWKEGLWELEGGWYVVDDPDTDGIAESRELYAEPYSIAMDAPQELSISQFSLNRSEHFSRTLSTAELGSEIKQLEQRGYDTTRLRVQYHAKWARPWAPLVMVLLGLPFAFKVGRRGSMYGVGVSLLLVLIYWGTFATFNALGLETLLDPLFAAWAPNVLFALVGSYLMLYIKT